MEGPPPAPGVVERARWGPETIAGRPTMPRSRLLRPADPAQIEMAEEVERVIETHDDDAMFCREVGPVIQRNTTRTIAEGASVRPDHYRSLIFAVQTRRPQLEDKAVFAHLPLPDIIAHKLN